MLQELLAADAIGFDIIVVKREAQQVCGESAEIETRIGAAALFEAIEVETTINAVVDAVPPQRTVDWSAPRPQRRFAEPPNAGPETEHEIRAGEQGTKRCVGPRDPRLKLFTDNTGYDAREHGG